MAALQPHRPLAHLEEADLVQRAQQGDELAFAELMRRNTSPSLRLALSVLKDRQEAEDQVQTSFLKAWTGLGNFHLDARFSTWFRTIVMNQCLMRLRVLRRARIQSLDDTTENEQPLDPPCRSLSPEEDLSKREMSSHLRREINRLPPLLRDVLILRDLEQLPIEEVAARLDLTEAATKSRLGRARTMLRERMERHMPASVALVTG
jgi:RNA polymerase sigma-70 factor (ECF subfamily)